MFQFPEKAITEENLIMDLQHGASKAGKSWIDGSGDAIKRISS